MKRIVLYTLLVLAAVTLYAADPYVPTDAERARWTLHDMMSWRTAIEAYATDHGVYPGVRTLEELRDAVQPLYIMHAPMHDAWGNPYRYERDEKIGYRLVSAGADGKFEPESWSIGGKRASFEDDAVVTPRERFWFRSWEFK